MFIFVFIFLTHTFGKHVKAKVNVEWFDAEEVRGIKIANASYEMCFFVYESCLRTEWYLMCDNCQKILCSTKREKLCISMTKYVW